MAQPSATSSTSTSLSSADLEMRRRATDLQDRTRRSARFSEVEDSLPVIKSVSLPRSVADALSYLGSRNPVPLPIGKDDSVWILDNTAFRPRRGPGWEAEVVAAAFAQEPSCTVVDFVAAVAEKVGIAEGDAARETIEERLKPFLADILPGRRIKLLHNATAEDDHAKRSLKLGPTGRNGISSDIRYLGKHHEAGDVALNVAEVPKGATGLLEGKTFFAEPEGWGVISDIDDTIKITQTSDPIGILRTTFVSKPTPTNGMPEFYEYMQGLISRDAPPWFYLSASPYNLYPFLRDFRMRYYPHGTIILRDSSWKTLPGLLSNLTLGTDEYKINRMEKIHTWLPGRRMICIGDSTQSDPEAYGEIYRKFPGWVHLILIRKVMDIAAVGLAAKNEPERFQKAFQGVPRDRWAVFEDPTEVYSLVKRTVLADEDDDEFGREHGREAARSEGDDRNEADDEAEEDEADRDRHRERDVERD